MQMRQHVCLGVRHADVARRLLDAAADEMDCELEICNHSHMGYYDMGMTDEEFLALFEQGRIHPHDFPHEAHIRAAWLLAREPDGYERLAAGIRTIAARAGKPEKFHETITRAWFELVAGAEALVPELYDRALLSRFYSAERLASGRERWVEPDLAPLRVASVRV